MTTNQQNREEWVEDYDKKFSSWQNTPHHMLKQFIRSTRQSAAKEGYDKGWHDGWEINGKGAVEAAKKRAREEVLREICICAAVKTTSGLIVRGNRHGDCMKTIVDMGLKISELPEDQGFITSCNRFVDRLEGRQLQDAAGIQSADQEGYKGNTLFSEDLY